LVEIRNKNRLLDNASSPLNRGAREIALATIEKALDSVDPRNLIRSRVILNGDVLEIDSNSFQLSDYDRIFVIGGGKASGFMAEALEEILGDWIKSGVVVIPHGTSNQYKTNRIGLHEAAHPIPDGHSIAGARKIADTAAQFEEDDLAICLISGGGSSLMAMPPQGVSLDDKKKVTDLLLKSGATINEINTVRKHISEFKGGMLAKRAYPATLVSLILSDVIGDNLDVIASGPTVPDLSTFQDAVAILKRYDLWTNTPNSVKKVLIEGMERLIPETPKLGDRVFEKVSNIVIGNNRLASLAAAKELQRRGINTLFLTSFMEGEARDVGLMVAALAREVSTSGNPVSKPAAIMMGGETTVTVIGSGVGGRNQEIALSASTKIEGMDGLVVISLSTDGIDGPTDAAGAMADGNTITRARKLGLNPQEYLKNNDSYSFFSKLGDLVFTGPTGTNVNDLSVIVMI